MHLEPLDADVWSVMQALRSYLQQHPRAVDTAAGIQRWWLLPSFGELPLSTVEAALAQLEAEGSVVRVDSAWGQAAWAARAQPSGDAAQAGAPGTR